MDIFLFALLVKKPVETYHERMLLIHRLKKSDNFQYQPLMVLSS